MTKETIDSIVSLYKKKMGAWMAASIAVGPLGGLMLLTVGLPLAAAGMSKSDAVQLVLIQLAEKFGLPKGVIKLIVQLWGKELRPK